MLVSEESLGLKEKCRFCFVKVLGVCKLILHHVFFGGVGGFCWVRLLVRGACHGWPLLGMLGIHVCLSDLLFVLHESCSIC